MPPQKRERIINSLSQRQAADLTYDWRGFWARPSQLPPGTPGANNPRQDWTYWILNAGRGFGKTRTGAETIRERAESGEWPIAHLVAPTQADIRGTMIEGRAGILSTCDPARRPYYEPSKQHRLTWPNGSYALGFSAEEPDRLRGPQAYGAWCDELSSWQNSEVTWDMLVMGIRHGRNPQIIITTTPKPTDHYRALLADSQSVVTSGTSYENRSNLSPKWFADIIKKYEGTRVGRQELLAELLNDREGALWTRDLIERNRVMLSQVPMPLVRVVVAVDPATTAKVGSDLTGMGAAGLGSDGNVYVLCDLTMKGSPGEWSRRACWAWGNWRADRIVAEVNNGGDMVEHAIRSVSPLVPYRAVHASRGKMLRAEPVAALYEQGRVKHIREYPVPELESQMCDWIPGVTQKSPDRIDWLVWAVYDLVLQPAEERARVTYDDRVAISRY